MEKERLVACYFVGCGLFGWAPQTHETWYRNCRLIALQHGQLSLAGDSVGSCFCLSELADLENRMAAPPRTVVSVSVTGCSNAGDEG